MNKDLIQLVNIICYRLEKCLRGADTVYFDFKMIEGSRSPAEILSHLVDVSKYGLHILNARISSKSPTDALETVTYNFESMKSYLLENEVDEESARKLINGPLSDILTHVGQLTFIRRLQGNPITRENYTNATI